MWKRRKEDFWTNFRRFFLRGLAIILPTVLTVWILVAAYNFVQRRIAEPINIGIRELIVRFSDHPVVDEEDMADHDQRTTAANKKRRREKGTASSSSHKDQLRLDTRRAVLTQQWHSYAFPLDLIGLVVAIFLIYVAGGLLGNFVGRRLLSRGEKLLNKVPLIRRVYPSVKQVTDFLVGGPEETQKKPFSRVVAVQYPRKGLWSIGLVTGQTLRKIQLEAEQECITVFVPSSPTPFTGYVITVPVMDSINLPITIEDALRFTISGGVLVPPSQQIMAMDESAGDT